MRRHLSANARAEFQHFSQDLIILDEVQKQPELLELIQVLVDKRPSVKGQFLLLGSNHLLLNKQVKESLAGRVAIFTLFPLSFRVFEQLLATRVGSLINYSSIAGNAGLSVDSIKRFLHYYRQLFMAWQCSPFHKNLASRVRKSSKWYFSDVGPLRLLLEDWRSDNGHIFENCVMTEIRKCIYYERHRNDLFFSRTAAGAEIDGVFESNSRGLTFFLEIKTGTRIRKADCRHLRRSVGDTPNSIGLLVANTPGIVQLENRIWGIPAAWLLV